MTLAQYRRALAIANLIYENRRGRNWDIGFYQVEKAAIAHMMKRAV